MRRDPLTTPPRLPRPAADLVGRTYYIPPDLVQYERAGFVVRLTEVREDISLWYGGVWVWIEGVQLDAQGDALAWVQALIHVDALGETTRLDGGV
ncbi:hypothetical protein Ais01nite_68010 [Asanoa ishikariensis]|uniref:Uncharacterized protein n=1 Tax=Asanoa ishikariensis TaxID=137265 RepID=A0A1H3NA61_9ACTN|nr:hypothetical protein [Asanoa ishikariensis]GIF68766.1 hypothetical protein Ais01nite_68010 [Asanoa ishikariensis]SDY85560.1 hypothetical protein SAMN05421684_1927 [Asanoa ishikariensis]